VNEELKVHWGVIKNYMMQVLKSQGVEQILAEEIAIFPGMEELFSVLKIMEYFEKGRYDVIILDCAPTGSTVRFLSFPEIFDWYMKKFFPLQRKLVRIFKPLAERVTKLPMPGDDVYASVEDLFHRVGRMKEILTDNKVTTVRLVFNPEKMVIQETQRAYTYLHLFGISVDAVIANKVYPPDITDPYFKKWMPLQEKYMEYARRSFSPLPILKSRLFQEELIGLAKLSKLAEEVFGKTDPSGILISENPISIVQAGRGYVMSIKAPGFQRDEIDMWVNGDEMIIKFKDFKRNIVLPRSLAMLDVKKAQMAGDTFKVTFG
jgi:arsenite-transporting ATPase